MAGMHENEADAGERHLPNERRGVVDRQIVAQQRLPLFHFTRKYTTVSIRLLLPPYTHLIIR